jgi:hypothetical protein
MRLPLLFWAAEGEVGAQKQKARFPAGLLQRQMEGKPGGQSGDLRKPQASYRKRFYNQVGW